MKTNRPKEGDQYYLKEDPKWIVTVERIEERPKFLNEPVVHITQPNGRNFFSLGFFTNNFKEYVATH